MYLNIKSSLSLAALALGAAFLSGCSGVNGIGGASGTQFLPINAVTNGGTGSVSADGYFFQAQGTTSGSTPNYDSISSGSTTFGFELSSDPLVSYGSNSQSLSAGSYSAVIVGDASITSSSTTGFPQILVLSNAVTTTVSGDAYIRFINAGPGTASSAPDALLNGSVTYSGSTVPYATYEAYEAVSPGAYTTAFATTGGTALTTTPTYTLQAGHQYTIYLLQTSSGASPTYAIGETDDTPPTSSVSLARPA